MAGGRTLEELALHARVPRALLAAVLEDEKKRGHVEQNGKQWSLTAATQKEFGIALGAIEITPENERKRGRPR